MGSSSRPSPTAESGKYRPVKMIEATDQFSAADNATDSQTIRHTLAEPGPLFKEIYSELIDAADENVWRSLMENGQRPLFAWTTNIQTLDQFRIIHQTQERSGTAFHHKTYLATIESLSVQPID